MTKFQFVAVAFIGIVIGFMGGYAWKANESPAIGKWEFVRADINYSVNELRTPDDWRKAGKDLVWMYANSPERVQNALTNAIMSEDSVLTGQQMRNEPILWVMAMITQNYGLIQFTSEQREKLKRLYDSKERGNLRQYLDVVLDERKD